MLHLFLLFCGTLDVVAVSFFPVHPRSSFCIVDGCLIFLLSDQSLECFRYDFTILSDIYLCFGIHAFESKIVDLSMYIDSICIQINFIRQCLSKQLFGCRKEGIRVLVIQVGQRTDHHLGQSSFRIPEFRR